MPRDWHHGAKPADNRASIPIESLSESLAEGIVTGHPTMPEFRLDPAQINDLIAYFKTLER